MKTMFTTLLCVVQLFMLGSKTAMASRMLTGCGGLGMEVCGDGTCDGDYVPVNYGGLSTICRKPEEAGPGNLAETVEPTPEPTEVEPTPEPTDAAPEGPTANCGGLGMEVCGDGTCEGDYVPVNKGGLSTICRKPEEADTGSTPPPAEAAPEPTPEPKGPAPGGSRENCGGLGMEVCGDGTCDGNYVPVNKGGLSTICRKPEEAASPTEGRPRGMNDPEGGRYGNN